MIKKKYKLNKITSASYQILKSNPAVDVAMRQNDYSQKAGTMDSLVATIAHRNAELAAAMQPAKDIQKLLSSTSKWASIAENQVKFADIIQPTKEIQEALDIYKKSDVAKLQLSNSLAETTHSLANSYIMNLEPPRLFNSFSILDPNKEKTTSLLNDLKDRELKENQRKEEEHLAIIETRDLAKESVEIQRQTMELQTTHLDFLKTISGDTKQIVDTLINLEQISQSSSKLTTEQLLEINQSILTLKEETDAEQLPNALMEEVRGKIFDKGVDYGLQVLFQGLKHLVTIGSII